MFRSKSPASVTPQSLTQSKLANGLANICRSGRWTVPSTKRTLSLLIHSFNACTIRSYDEPSMRSKGTAVVKLPTLAYNILHSVSTPTWPSAIIRALAVTSADNVLQMKISHPTPILLRPNATTLMMIRAPYAHNAGPEDAKSCLMYTVRCYAVLALHFDLHCTASTREPQSTKSNWAQQERSNVAWFTASVGVAFWWVFQYLHGPALGDTASLLCFNCEGFPHPCTATGFFYLNKITLKFHNTTF